MRLSFSFFFTSILLVTVLGHLYLYVRLLRQTGLSRWGRWLGVATLVGLGAVVLLARRARSLPPEWSVPLGRVGWVWFGTLTYLVMALMVTGAALWLWRRRARDQAAHADEQGLESRRLFLTRAAAVAGLAGGGATAAFGSWRAFTPTRVEEVVVRLPLLPRALDGLTLVQLSDVHLGPFIRRRFMDEVVGAVNALKPDAVMLTGDLVDGAPSELGEAAAAFANLRSRFGTFMVTGNHEYYSGDERWAAAFSGLGVEVLRNRHVKLGDRGPGGASLDLVGVDDWMARARYPGRGYDLEAALAGRAPDRAAVLLAHQPANWRNAASRGVGLQLSGHTHGGQLFPMTLLIPLQWEHVAGLYREGDASLYVSRGTGFWGPPMRVGSPPEITKIVLTA